MVHRYTTTKESKMKLTTWIMVIIALSSTLIYNQSQAIAANPAETAAFASEQLELININTASADILANLPGLGPKKAQAIIEYRERNGNFSSIEELVNVKGIGEKMMAKLMTLVTV